MSSEKQVCGQIVNNKHYHANVRMLIYILKAMETTGGFGTGGLGN